MVVNGTSTFDGYVKTVLNGANVSFDGKGIIVQNGTVPQFDCTLYLSVPETS
ncbi:hypothetical protein DVH05_025617 [Phytophthora capsici]|nr:hypothetical protein DVH05_025617 [Phytophthora capsici]